MVQNSLCDQLILFGQQEDKLSAAPERVWRFFCVYACADSSARQARIVLSFGCRSVLTDLKFSTFHSFACHIVFLQLLFLALFSMVFGLNLVLFCRRA